MSAVGKQIWGHALPSCNCFNLQRPPYPAQAARLLARQRQLQSSSGHICMHQFTTRSVAENGLGIGASPDSTDARAAQSGGAAELAVAVRTGAGRILDTELHAEVEKSYLAYAMSVIVGRALPDVRDGLKPVHRRILFAMHELGLAPNKPFRKSARVVGEVLGKYHPHGDTAVYDALVRLAQPFSMRLPLINGHGNFGSQDDDPPAAMRYTECRLQQAASSALLMDLECDTVDFLDTFDGAQQEPSVLPARLPNLLINGSQGIAVGMATNIPPHNLVEVVSGLKALIDNPDISLAQLMTHIPGPDFPTGGEIVAAEGIADAYLTGRGPITIRGRAFIEEDSTVPGGSGRKGSKRGGPAKPVIIITELPFQTNKAKLVEHIAQLTDSGSLQGISDVRDESDREGMRVVVELKRGTNAEVVLNNLYKHTQLQKRFSCNLVALVAGTPRTLSLKDFLSSFLEFRCQVITRRAQFELVRAQKRSHIVDGLLSAQQKLDRVVATIRSASDGPAASQQLQAEFGLSPEQADAVLSMALRRLTSLEAGRLQREDEELKAQIGGLQALLASPQAIRETVAREADSLAGSLGNDRRTLVRRDVDGQIHHEDIIPNRQSLVVFSRRGYIKRMTPDLFSTQGRGGKGMKGASLRDNDTVEEVQQVRDHQSMLFFTTDGQVFAVKAYDIPQASRTAAGTALPQLLKIGKEQKVTAMLPVDHFSEAGFVLLLTSFGWFKRVALDQFSAKRPGTGAISLVEGDELVWVQKCRVGDDIMIATSDGQVARYSSELFRPMGRKGRGLLAVNLKPETSIVGMTVLPHQDMVVDEAEEDEADGEGEAAGELDAVEDPCILFITEKGMGKRVPAHLFRSFEGRKRRGTMGIAIAAGDRLAAFQVVADEKEVLLVTSNGLLTRISMDSVPMQRRQSKGVILMRLNGDGDRISTVTLLEDDMDDLPELMTVGND